MSTSDRAQFEAARAAGLRTRHRRRLEHAGRSCAACDASLGGCETKRWLSGRACCAECAHDPDSADPQTRTHSEA